MPKRLVDGDALASSQKLMLVDVQYRGEFSYLLTLANHEGVFAASPRAVWARQYSFNRPDYNPDRVESMIQEYESAGMIMRWTEPDGTNWGYFIGIDRAGRLPAPSKQKEYGIDGTPHVPKDRLKEYLAKFNDRRTRRLAENSEDPESPQPIRSESAEEPQRNGSGEASVEMRERSGSDAEPQSALGLVLASDLVSTKELSPVQLVAKGYDVTEAFERFWEVCPRKEAKKPSLERFKRVAKSEAMAAELIASMMRYAETGQVQDALRKKQPQFISLPSTWLNAERWKDEVIRGNGGNGNGKHSGSGQPKLSPAEKKLEDFRRMSKDH